MCSSVAIVIQIQKKIKRKRVVIAIDNQRSKLAMAGQAKTHAAWCPITLNSVSICSHLAIPDSTSVRIAQEPHACAPPAHAFAAPLVALLTCFNPFRSIQIERTICTEGCAPGLCRHQLVAANRSRIDTLTRARSSRP